MTPTETILAAAQSPIMATDADGRHLAIRRLTALDKLRLFKAAGPNLAQNPAWLGLAVLACSVTAIDAMPVPQPNTEAQIEALVGRLGDRGLDAVASALDAAEPTDASVDMAGN